MVKSSEDDLVSSSDQTHSGQQLQDQSFGPTQWRQRATISRIQSEIFNPTNSDKTFQRKIKDFLNNHLRNLQGAGQIIL